jgi:hypothetical protein
MPGSLKFLFDIIKDMGSAAVQPRTATDEVDQRTKSGEATLSAFPHLSGSWKNRHKEKRPNDCNAWSFEAN